jgi:hypothetical protein
MVGTSHLPAYVDTGAGAGAGAVLVDITASIPAGCPMRIAGPFPAPGPDGAEVLGYMVRMGFGPRMITLGLDGGAEDLRRLRALCDLALQDVDGAVQP